ncbi:hypothetical protein FHS95_003133 [Sphingomonas naasensis]|uniref:Lipoprotein n=1 Tax=Sphingomonas naasensis TaxID=1344951 RepID=A0A4S1WIV3_9SPHN|nr:DUF6491 family protein [Sphingomonas naasensis]NIJ21430.1 hypothetical protein [Sphingomonas naasensis]TGX41610.1 hypothetical protein E5A74_13440 [Sphingomonas naasensis]
MSRNLLPQLALALLLGACTTTGEAPPRGSEVSIPFLTGGQIRTFEPERDGSGVFIQNSRRDWFHVRFFTRCNELPFAVRIGFQTFGNSSTLSRGDTIIAGRDRCRISSITRSDPPPSRRRQQQEEPEQPPPSGT